MKLSSHTSKKAAEEAASVARKTYFSVLVVSKKGGAHNVHVGRKK